MFLRLLRGQPSHSGTPTEILTGEPGTFSARPVGTQLSCVAVGANPGCAFQRQSASNDRVSFLRASNADGTAWGQEIYIHNTATADTIESISLAVVGSQPAAAFVIKSGSTRQVYYARATDATGGAWGAAVAVGVPTGDVAETDYGVSLWEVNGRPAIAYANTTAVLYRRSDDATGAAWTAAPIVVKSGDEGSYFTLRELNGAPVISYFNNEPISKYPQFARAADADGSAPWTVTSTSTGAPGSMLGSVSYAVVNGNPAVAHYKFGTPARLCFNRADDNLGLSWTRPSTCKTVATNGHAQHGGLVFMGGLPHVFFRIGGVSKLEWNTADDINGTAWTLANKADVDPSTANQELYGQAWDANGQPAVAYSHGGDLWFTRQTSTSITPGSPVGVGVGTKSPTTAAGPTSAPVPTAMPTPAPTNGASALQGAFFLLVAALLSLI